MSSTSKRFIKSGVLLGLAAVASAGCAVTTSGVTPRASVVGPGAGYVVCSGGHASRFPEHAEIGRVCRPVASMYAIY